MMRTFSGGGLLGETKTTGTEDEAVDVVVRVARLVHCSRVGPRVWARVTCVAAGEKREAVLGPADVRENAFAERGAAPRGKRPDFNMHEFFRPENPTVLSVENSTREKYPAKNQQTDFNMHEFYRPSTHLRG